MVNFCLIWDETPSAVGQKLVMKCLPIIGQISNPKEQLIYVWHQSLTRQPQPLKSPSHPPLAWLTLTKLPGGTGNFLTQNSSCISLLRFLGSALRFEVRFYLLCQKEYNPMSESCSVTSNSLRPHGLYSPWNSPGQKTGVYIWSLLQRIFPAQISNPGLPHCSWILYQLSLQGSPYWLKNPLSDLE